MVTVPISLIRKHIFHYQRLKKQINFMLGLPENIDLSFLVGRKVETLRIGRHKADIFFESDMSEQSFFIEMGGDIIFTDSNGIIYKIENYKINGGVLCTLIGDEIENALRHESGGLTLKMRSGSKVDILNDMPNYESVIIHNGDNVIVG